MIKEKIQSAMSPEEGGGFSEQTALVITILGIVLLLLILGMVIYFILPKTKVEISLSGPKTAKVGEEVSYEVTVKNTGSVILTRPELVFHYPSSCLPEKKFIETVQLENLYPKEEKKFTFKARLFGTEGAKNEFKTWLNYAIEGKEGIKMSQPALFSTVISEVPIDLILDIPKKAPVYPKDPSNFTFRIRYFSSIEQAVPNLKLSLKLPSKFTLKESSPQMADGQKIEIKTLEPRTENEVEILGALPAGYQTEQELEFNANLFIDIQGTDVLLKSVSAKAVTYAPLFAFSQKIHNEENYVPYPGEKLYYQINFKNIQDQPLRDLSLTTVLEGNLFDLSTIEAPSGTFTKGKNSISWDGEKIPELRYLTPGQEGKVEFWVTLKDDYKPKDLTETNAFIRNRVILADFENEFRNRVNSLIKISQEGYFNDKYHFFENSGPQPPQVNKATFYTIVWKIENYYNSLENAVVKATLPTGVSVRQIKTAAKGEINVLTYPAPSITPFPDIPSTFRFEKPLFKGMTDTEVTYLQLILKSEVPKYYPKNVAATGYFGPVTFEAVKGFQIKYKDEILVPQGISTPSGYVDELTQKKLNEILIKAAPPSSAEVSWSLGDIKPGVGVFEEPLVAAFQISFVPEVKQKGKVATLINEARLSVKDQWTGFSLYMSDAAIDTDLPDDPTCQDNGVIK